MKEKYYMIIEDGELLPHTARKCKKECIGSFVEELSDGYNNPDVDSILSDVENGFFKGLKIECKLVEIKVLRN